MWKGLERLSGLSMKSLPAPESVFACVTRAIRRGRSWKTTQCGPHRDDLAFLVNDVDIRKFGSQGQQRTAALSLKLAEIELVKQEIRDNPVLLLDDVLSELDRNRQHYLLDSIKEIQTLITCTGIDDFVKNQFEINRVFRVVNGTVSEKLPQ